MRNIRWSKWRDPVLPLINGQKVEQNYEPEEGDEHPNFPESEESWGEVSNPYHKPSENGYLGPCVFSPFGVIPLHEHNAPGALFNFWVGDTDFDLTKKVVKTIGRVPGVETLDVPTRYRFRMGVGRCFNADDVKRAVERAVNPEETPPAPQTPVARMRRRLERFPFWAILLIGGGGYDALTGETADEVRGKLEAFRAVAEPEKVLFSWESGPGE